MTGFVEDDLLRFEGLDDNDIADLNAALPAIAAASAAIQAQWPAVIAVWSRLAPLVPALSPHIPALARIAGKIIAKQKELTS